MSQVVYLTVTTTPAICVIAHIRFIPPTLLMRLGKLRIYNSDGQILSVNYSSTVSADLHCEKPSTNSRPRPKTTASNI